MSIQNLWSVYDDLANATIISIQWADDAIVSVLYISLYYIWIGYIIRYSRGEDGS